jgi:hypothetical protein
MPTNYKPRKISGINPKTDNKISIVGKIVDIKENSFILEDDYGKIEIFSEEKVEKNKVVRVFCSLVDGKLKADLIQNLEGMDLNLFKKVQELYYRVGLNV